MTTQDDIETIAEYIGFDIATFNRFIEAAKMCGYSLVRDGNRLVAPPCADLETVKAALVESQALLEELARPPEGSGSISSQVYWARCVQSELKIREALAALGRIRGE